MVWWQVTLGCAPYQSSTGWSHWIPDKKKKKKRTASPIEYWKAMKFCSQCHLHHPLLSFNSALSRCCDSRRHRAGIPATHGNHPWNLYCVISDGTKCNTDLVIVRPIGKSVRSGTRVWAALHVTMTNCQWVIVQAGSRPRNLHYITDATPPTSFSLLTRVSLTWHPHNKNKQTNLFTNPFFFLLLTHSTNYASRFFFYFHHWFNSVCWSTE